jgi:hypothetical protein
VASLEGLDPSFRFHAERFWAWAKKQPKCSNLVITSGRRTREQQEYLWREYQAGRNNGLPATPPGSSDHEMGLAFDMARIGVDPLEDPVLAELGEAWQLAGGRWWSKDPVHFGAPLGWLTAKKASPSSWSPPSWVP